MKTARDTLVETPDVPPSTPVHHPRRLRLSRLRLSRLLLLTPFVLLGVALCAFSRRPRPQTEGDKWLWEQADTSYCVTISLPDAPPHPDPTRIQSIRMQQLEVRDRAGMRALLRAFRQTTFLPIKQEAAPLASDCQARIYFLHRGTASDFACSSQVVECGLRFYHKGGQAYLWRSDGTQTRLDAASARRFENLLSSTISQAMRKQRGYALHTWNIET